MKLAEKRQCAIAAICHQVRKQNEQAAKMAAEYSITITCPSLETMSADEALTVLDDISRAQPELVASHWYVNASQRQLELFEHDWKQKQKTLRLMTASH